MSKNFRETLNEQLRDPAFQAEWETLEPERQIIRAIIEGRERCDLTQQQLAEIPCAIFQSADIRLLNAGNLGQLLLVWECN